MYAMYRATVIVLALALVVIPMAPAAGQESQESPVNGFHGYAWGTLPGDIREIVDAPAVPTMDVLEAYVGDGTIFGYSAVVAFYFLPGEGLIMGAYTFDLEQHSCHRAFERFDEAIQESFPSLVRQAREPSMSEAESTVYDSVCEYFSYNPEASAWLAGYRQLNAPAEANPDIVLMMQAESLSPRLLLAYRSPAMHELEASQRGEQRNRLGPVRDTTLWRHQGTGLSGIW